MSYEERDITVNQAYIKELIDLGSRGTPTTVVTEGESENVVIGFDLNRLAHLLGV